MTALTIRAADLERARPPRWVWDRRIALGYLNLLLGNEGVGKGTFIVWLLSMLTLGRLPGSFDGRPVSVAVAGDEDSFDDVWVPRLHARGADLDRVIQVERPDGGFINLREDKARLGAVIVEHKIEMLFLDQLLDNLGVGTDDFRQKAVRDALQPGRALARETSIAVVGSLHPNKRAESFRQLMAGAPAFNAVSRSSLLLAQHPEDERRRVIVRGKGNLSAAPSAVEFAIHSHRFAANGHQFNVPLATDFTESTMTVDDLVGTETAVLEHSKIADACDIIESLLPRDDEWHPAKPIYEACAVEEIDERTAKRAKARLEVEHRRTQTFPATVEWRWPPTPDTHRTPVHAFPTVPTVPTVNGQEPPLSGSEDTQDTRDYENTRPQCVPAAEELPDGYTEDDIERLAAAAEATHCEAQP